MNQHQTSFARQMTPSLACAMGRQIVVPPVGLPTTLNDRQMTPHSKGWGNPLGTSCAETLAGRQGRGRVLTVGVSRFVSLTGDASIPDDVMPSLTRPGACNALGHFFSVDFQLLESHFQCVSQANPSHSPNSAAAYVPKHRSSRSHEIGNPSQTGAA